jgi:hypothetical protein
LNKDFIEGVYHQAYTAWPEQIVSLFTLEPQKITEGTFKKAKESPCDHSGYNLTEKSEEFEIRLCSSRIQTLGLYIDRSLNKTILII